MNNKLVILLLGLVAIASTYPVPIPPGGRNAVHGWLILPFEQTAPTDSDPTTPVSAWFVHHTPEFWVDSPHNFQIILSGTMTPISVDHENTYPIDIPYPPLQVLLQNEYTITPPPPFSLNDLLSGTITQLIGVVYNGSFDTSYERIPIAIAILNIDNLTTAVYLNISSEIVPFTWQRYYSYPRDPAITTDNVKHYYLSHQIHASPDFDQVVHVTMSDCQCTGDDCDWMNLLMHKGGAVWEIPGIENSLEKRLMPTEEESLEAHLIGSGDEALVKCQMVVLEEIHCVIGPDFFNICPPIPKDNKQY